MLDVTTIGFGREGGIHFGEEPFFTNALLDASGYCNGSSKSAVQGSVGGELKSTKLWYLVLNICREAVEGHSN